MTSETYGHKLDDLWAQVVGGMLMCYVNKVTGVHCSIDRFKDKDLKCSQDTSTLVASI